VPEASCWISWCSSLRLASRSVLPAADSIRFRRRVHMQGNRPRACRLGAVGAGAEQKRRTGDATKRGGPAGGYAGVPTVFLQHTRMSKGGSAREQEDPEVRGGVGIANQSGRIGFSHKTTTSSSSYSLPIGRARPQHIPKAPGPSYRASLNPFAETSPANRHHHESPRGLPLRPFSTHYNPLASFFVTHGTSPLSSSSHHRSCSPQEFTFHPFSATTKVTPRFALIH
jgi:hypothetical protein